MEIAAQQREQESQRLMRESDSTDIVVDGNINKCGNYALKDGTKVKITPVNHPSVGYSWDFWHKVIAEFLKR